MNKRVKVILAIIAGMLVVLGIIAYCYFFYPFGAPDSLTCSKDSDCIIRANNYGKTEACLKIDRECRRWAWTIETGSPGYTVLPNPDDTVARCVEGECKRAYDCSKCDKLREQFHGCTNGDNLQMGLVCSMYLECGC